MFVLVPVILASAWLVTEILFPSTGDPLSIAIMRGFLPFVVPILAIAVTVAGWLTYGLVQSSKRRGRES
ncbi:MAG: hypothetical protein KDK89_18880 [Alphaproteobacteria bacterium]|nr:hypothetical protein [Alphaproteobacteria bacterium]